MFKKRTLFVVGAGASAEYNLLQGAGLAKLIGAKTRVTPDDGYNGPITGDKDILARLINVDRARINDYLAAARIISEGVELSSSIDDFLDIHSGNADVRTVGKVAIVKAILEQEQGSPLFVDRSNLNNRLRVSMIENTWLIKLVRILGRGVSRERIGDIFANVAFIVFNYDRCIEHALYFALQQLYSVDGRVAAQIIDRLSIIHPYGKVGDLRTETKTGGLAFGGERTRIHPDYLNVSEGISTYTEEMSAADQLAAIRHYFEITEQIVFLGFAYHDQNMKLLKPTNAIEPKKVFGTAYGMSDSDVEIVKNQILHFFPEAEWGRIMHEKGIDIRNDNLKCADFIDQYGRTLSG